MKKILFFLSMAILFVTAHMHAQTLPTTFWSTVANTDWYNDTDNEFTLTTAEELAGLSAIVAGGNDFSGKTAILANDIDLGEHLWKAIGPDNDHHFSGSFDGSSHTISNLFINEPQADFIGLFGQCTNSTLSNIKLATTYIRAKDTAGSLAGNLSTNSNMTNCHAVNVDIEGGLFSIGGLVGGLITNSNMTRCSAQGSVAGSHQIGGLVGSPWDKTNIIECYSAGTVTASHLAGGLVGYTTFAFGPDRNNTINNCYSRCNVIVTSGRAGGIVGSADALFIYNSYATGSATGPQEIGGVIGYAGGVTTINNYWDLETSANEEAIGDWGSLEPGEFEITGMTTTEMKTAEMVDLLNQGQSISPWTINPEINDGYPSFTGTTTVSAPTIQISNVEVSVYPTLVEAHIQIESIANLKSYTIYDVTGKIVNQGTLIGNVSQIDTQNLASGAYILLINTDQGSASQKFMKK